MGITLQEFEVLCAAAISSEIGESVKRVIVQSQNKKNNKRYVSLIKAPANYIVCER